MENGVATLWKKFLQKTCTRKQDSKDNGLFTNI